MLPIEEVKAFGLQLEDHFTLVGVCNGDGDSVYHDPTRKEVVVLPLIELVDDYIQMREILELISKWMDVYGPTLWPIPNWLLTLRDMHKEKT